MKKRATKWIGAPDAVGVQESGIEAHVIVHVRSPNGGSCISEDEAARFISEIRKAIARNKRRFQKKATK